MFCCFSICINETNSRTYRASNDKKDDVVPASNNLSHIHKLILETQKRFRDQEQERRQMEVYSTDFCS